MKSCGRLSIVRIIISFSMLTESKAALTSKRMIMPPLSMCFWARGPRSAPNLFGTNPNWVWPKSLGKWGVIDERKKSERTFRKVFSKPIGLRFNGVGGRFFFGRKINEDSRI